MGGSGSEVTGWRLRLGASLSDTSRIRMSCKERWVWM